MGNQLRKVYSSLDIMKFIMAMLILTQHTCNEWAHSTGIVHAFFGLGNFAVPFFFACSGFLFFSKYDQLDAAGKKTYYRSWSYRIGKMYLVWSSIYFLFVVHSWFNNGFVWEKPLMWIHRSIVFSTYATIWFLPALWLGVSICCWLKNKFTYRASLAIVIILMIIGNLFGSYSNIIVENSVLRHIYEWYMKVFITWRNGVFNGAPYVFIGLMIAVNAAIRKLSHGLNLYCALFFSLAFLAEAFCITHYHLSAATDMGFMMAPATFFIMNTLVHWDIKEQQIWVHCRNLSMLVFLGQRLFLSALPSVIPSLKFWISDLSEPLIFVYFIVVTLSFSIIIERLSSRFKLLKNLW